MSKRPTTSTLEDRGPKRTRLDDPAELLKRAEDLVDCLRALKKYQRGVKSGNAPGAELSVAHERLSLLSRDIIPLLQALAPNDEAFFVETGRSGSSRTEPPPQVFHVQEEPAIGAIADQHKNSSGLVGNNGKPINKSDVPSPGQQISISHGPIRGVLHVSRWVSSEIPHKLPPLPKVTRPELEEAAFTHPGLTTGKPSYERLEWLGDSFLEMLSTILIDRTFLQTPSGRCSQLRERIVRNVTLAQYFRDYNLESRARLPPEFNTDARVLGRGRSKDKDLIKTQADMFEAYVAAAILSDPENGLVNTTEWLKALWGQTILEDIRNAEAQLVPSVKVATDKPSAEARSYPPKEVLARKIAGKGILIRYEDIPSNKKNGMGLPLFSVGVFLTGWGEVNKLLGVGEALGKKEAGQNAATEALEKNSKLIQGYEQKKKAELEARAALG